MAYINKPKKKSRSEQTDRNRRERQKLYQTKAWKDKTLSKRIHSPLCEVCAMEGKIKPATDTHHLRSPFKERIDASRPDLGLFYDSDNLMSLCDECHQRLHHGNLKGCKTKEEIIQYLTAQKTYAPLDNLYL